MINHDFFCIVHAMQPYLQPTSIKHLVYLYNETDKTVANYKTKIDHETVYLHCAIANDCHVL